MAELVYGASGDVRLELGNPTETEVSASLVDISRRRATRVINTYVVKAYPDSFPFASESTVPLILNSIANDLSVYYVKRSIHQGPTPLSDEVKIEYYDKSIELLELIRDGEVKLEEIETGATGVLVGGEVDANRSDYHPIFDVDESLNHSVDPDLEDDIADDRT